MIKAILIKKRKKEGNEHSSKIEKSGRELNSKSLIEGEIQC